MNKLKLAIGEHEFQIMVTGKQKAERLGNILPTTEFHFLQATNSWADYTITDCHRHNNFVLVNDMTKNKKEFMHCLPLAGLGPLSFTIYINSFVFSQYSHFPRKNNFSRKSCFSVNNLDYHHMLENGSE